MTASEKLFQLYKDYSTAKEAFGIYRKNAGDILAAVTSRIEADQAQVREWAATLKTQISDGIRTATVGDQSDSLQQRWIDSDRVSFSARCMGVDTV